MHADEAGVNRLSERIIGCAFRVLNTLGAGFLEKVYENALAHELRKNGLAVAQQQGISVRYDGIVVGEYAVDLLVEEIIIIELKAIKALDNAHMAQCLNYLKAADLRYACCSISASLALRFSALPTHFEAAPVYRRASACICG
jgi:GxxExxY protein